MAVEPETRIKVFVSYSRADKAFADDLVLGLAACGFAPYIDREDIAAGEDWGKRLAGLIAEADTIVCVISPDSLSSKECAAELHQALKASKRILPVVWRQVEDTAAPAELRRLNYIYFSGEGRTFAAGLAQLAEAMRTDIEWIREHTRIGSLAARWMGRGRSEALLLRGDELDAALAWRNGKPVGAPTVTDEQADFIKASADARVEAERRAARARAGLLTAVSAAALVFAALAGVAGLMWQAAAKAEGVALAANTSLEAANKRLGAEVWLRTAPSTSGYYVVDKGWYQVAANYSGAIARVDLSGAGRRTLTTTGMIIEGGVVHPRYAGEPLLLVLAERPPDEIAGMAVRPSDSIETPPVPSDTLPADAPRQPQGILGEVIEGEERLAATFPALGGGPIEGSELVWQTPAHVAAEPPFMVWRLATRPPAGWRAIAESEIECADLDVLPEERTVAVLGVGVPAEGGPSENALAINISELIDGTDVRAIAYTHATNRSSAGAPAFSLSTGRIFAVHRGSAPDPARPGARYGYGYSMKFILDVVRSSVKAPALPPLCGG
jgi:hypothetical protein